MKIYLAGQNWKNRIITELLITPPESRKMKVFLAGEWPCGDKSNNISLISGHKPYILESFFNVNKNTERLLPYYGDFLLDSGAFTFMQGNGKVPDWNAYIERYADFIVRNDIKKFFELDIDSVVGYSKVLEFRKKLEDLTSRPCIPVWHISRGIDEFKKMCDEYSYVALGGIAIKEIKKEGYKYFPILINEAHKREAKIHGLGFTNLSLLHKYHFDSVDSTTWTAGNRFGYGYYFDGKTMKKKKSPKRI